jgi:hypothetical protein
MMEVVEGGATYQRKVGAFLESENILRRDTAGAVPVSWRHLHQGRAQAVDVPPGVTPVTPAGTWQPSLSHIVQ